MKSRQIKNMKRSDSERERLLGAKQAGSIIDDAINDGNEFMIDDLEQKTTRLLQMTKSVQGTLLEDEELRGSLADTIFKSDTMMNKGRALLSNVTNDPTYFGVFKIAMLVFTSLCVLYFGGKLFFRLLSSKDQK